MRIAFITDAFPAVSETFILNQVTGLLDLGHDVSVFTGSGHVYGGDAGGGKSYGLADRTFCHNEKPRGVFPRVSGAFPIIFRRVFTSPMVVLRSLNFFRYGMDALSLGLLYKADLFLEKGRFDVIYCQFGTNGNIGAILKELGIRGKLVTMFHGYDVRRGVAEGGGIYKKLFRLGDLFLSISDYNYKHLVGFGADPARIRYHPVGIDPDEFPFKERAPRGTLNILTVARLVREKALDNAIKALHILVKEYGMDNIKYLIAGGGPEEDHLKELAAELGVSDKMKFAGPLGRAEVIRLYAEAHLYVLSSAQEALPVTLMEAQASGLPVVSTDVGSVNEIVADGRTGFLVRPGDERALAGKIRELMDQPGAWPGMGKAGRGVIEEKYDIRKLNRELVGIFEGLTRGRDGK